MIAISTSPAPAQVPAPTRNVGVTTLWIDGRILLAALKFVSEDETRRLLCGVCVDVTFETETADAQVLVLATDGRRAIAMKALTCDMVEHDYGDRDPFNDGPLALGDRFILPADLIKRIKPLVSKGEPKVQLEIARGPKDGQRRVSVISPVSKRGVIGETIAEVYPPVGRVFVANREPLVGGTAPKEGEDARAGSQFFGSVYPEYIADFGEALKTMGAPSNNVAIWRGGDASCVMHLRPTVQGALPATVEAIVMPVRMEDADHTWEPPAWLAELTAEAARADAKQPAHAPEPAPATTTEGGA